VNANCQRNRRRHARPAVARYCAPEKVSVVCVVIVVCFVACRRNVASCRPRVGVCRLLVHRALHARQRLRAPLQTLKRTAMTFCVICNSLYLTQRRVTARCVRTSVASCCRSSSGTVESRSGRCPLSASASQLAEAIRSGLDPHAYTAAAFEQLPVVAFLQVRVVVDVCVVLSLNKYLCAR
jgi:hypothetical protein